MRIVDCSTVISIVPFDIRATKPGIYPGHFFVPACLDDNSPSRLFIPEPATHLMTIGGKKDPIAIPTPSYELARSVVQDFLAEQLWTDENAHPGIVFFQGDVSVVEFLTKHKEIHQEMKEVQKRWFLNLIEQTDNDWNKYKNKRVVSGPARLACEKLKLDKEWMRDEALVMKYISCPACTVRVTPETVVCPNCRCVLDKKKHAELTFA